MPSCLLAIRIVLLYINRSSSKGTCFMPAELPIKFFCYPCVGLKMDISPSPSAICYGCMARQKQHLCLNSSGQTKITLRLRQRHRMPPSSHHLPHNITAAEGHGSRACSVVLVPKLKHVTRFKTGCMTTGLQLTPNWPCSFHPHANASPLQRMARLCSAPTATCFTEPNSPSNTRQINRTLQVRCDPYHDLLVA